MGSQKQNKIHTPEEIEQKMRQYENSLLDEKVHVKDPFTNQKTIMTKREYDKLISKWEDLPGDFKSAIERSHESSNNTKIGSEKERGDISDRTHLSNNRHGLNSESDEGWIFFINLVCFIIMGCVAYFYHENMTWIPIIIIFICISIMLLVSPTPRR